MMKLSTQAYFTFIASIILVVALLIPTQIKVYDPDTNIPVIVPYDVKKRLFLALLISIPLAIHVYSVNCLTVGNCNTYAWIVASLIVLWILSFIVLAFLK